jgi:hypothetical protein
MRITTFKRLGIFGFPNRVNEPPKRFAQAIGAAFSLSAAVAALGFGDDVLASVLLSALALAAGLESIFAICLGCQAFALLMRVGLVPQQVCLECAGIRASA